MADTQRAFLWTERLWWLAVAALWLLNTYLDRIWLAADQRLPSWDQADYLNSAVDHGRALGLLTAANRSDWQGLLDLSPKIPPLASLINGSVMAFSGVMPDQACWSLALWHGVLLIVVACWGRQLIGQGFGLLCVALVAIAPGLVALRVDYTLDLPLTAATTLALWLLGRWQTPGTLGGGWLAMAWAALALSAAVMVKQSALLMVVPPALWAAVNAWPYKRRRLQVLVATSLVFAAILPWLHHNWITTLGGTERAVISSAAEEGDPSPISLESLLWYPRRLPAKLGNTTTWIGLGGTLLSLLRRHSKTGPGWPWLIGCALSGLLFTTLSPNKDDRYIAPVLPLLLILLARGWWLVLAWLERHWGRRSSLLWLLASLLCTASGTALTRQREIEAKAGSPVTKIMAELRGRVGSTPTTLLVIPTTASLNQHNVTLYGRIKGGNILGREVGKKRLEHPLVLDTAEWFLLASGDQGTRRDVSRELSQQVRRDGRYRLLKRWPWSKQRHLELWQRRLEAERPTFFDQRFVQLASGMTEGPAGLAEIFAAINTEHQLDGHFLYQEKVLNWAQAQLKTNSEDVDALWSLALLAVLQNRPQQASDWFEKLEQMLPANPWPSAYRAVVLLADWRPRAAARVAQDGHDRHQEPVLKALADLAACLSGNVARLPAARHSVPKAVEVVKKSIEAKS